MGAEGGGTSRAGCYDKRGSSLETALGRGGRAGEAAPGAPRSRSAPLAELFLRGDEGSGPGWRGGIGCVVRWGRVPLPHTLGLWPPARPAVGVGIEVSPGGGASEARVLSCGGHGLGHLRVPRPPCDGWWSDSVL